MIETAFEMSRLNRFDLIFRDFVHEGSTVFFLRFLQRSYFVLDGSKIIVHFLRTKAWLTQPLITPDSTFILERLKAYIVSLTLSNVEHD